MASGMEGGKMQGDENELWHELGWWLMVVIVVGWVVTVVIPSALAILVAVLELIL